MFRVFVDFIDGFNLALEETFMGLPNAVTMCNTSHVLAPCVHFSVWRGGMCYYSTDKTISIDVKIKK